jgi:hypothetical protein
MAEQQKGNRKRGIVQIAGLFLLLVALPLGSWYYLQTGLNYRLQAREELQPIADMPSINLANYDGQRFTKDTFQTRLLVGHFFSETHKDKFLPLLARIYDQFDERKEVLFLSMSTDTSLDMKSRAASMLDDHMLVDKDQVYFTVDTKSRQLAENIKMPFDQYGMSLENNSLLFFADSATVKYVYDFTRPEEVKMLIKHLTLNLHPDEEQDIIFERETEK